MSQYNIEIKYRDDKVEETIVDDYEITNNCLCIHKRYGIESGTRYIPLDRIKEFKID